MSEIMYVGQRQDFSELLAQSNFHFVLTGVNSVLSQAAGFDITIQDHDLVTGLRDFLCREKSRRSRANDEHRLHPGFLNLT